MVEKGNSHDRCGSRKMAEHLAVVLASKEREGAQKKRELKEGMRCLRGLLCEMHAVLLSCIQYCTSDLRHDQGIVPQIVQFVLHTSCT